MTRTLQRAAALQGALTLPGDKSISHRSLLLNALASGEARIEGFLPSADCLSTMHCLRAYGVQFDYDPDVDPTSVTVRSPGRAAFVEPEDVLDCGNSGTSIRLLSGIAAGRDFLTRLDGDASLRTRPMNRVLRPLATMGSTVDASDGGLAPFAIRGPALLPFRGRMEVASAQVKSAIVLAALDSDGVSLIEEAGHTRDHTENMLSAMGADIRREAPSGAFPTVEIHPGAELHPVDMTVPGDISSAAFWLVAGTVVPNSEIHLRGVGINPTRAGVLEVLNAMGARIDVEEERSVGGEPVADLVVRSADLHGITIDGDLVVRGVDELPVLAVAAAAAQGRTELRDAQELRVKETDRVAATVANLRALGVDIEERPDGFVIEGGRELHAGALDSYGDHRLAMAAAVAALIASGESHLKGAEDVIISYPRFWDDLEELTQAEALA